MAAARTRRAARPRGGRRTLARLAALALALAAPAAAEPGPETPPAPSTADAAAPPPPADRARAAIEAHCGECRARHGGDGAFDLAALADDPRLVRPGRPDASRLYQRLLADASVAPADAEAVRDWIAGLAAPDAGCRGRAPLTPADADAAIDRWVEAVGVVEATDTRFVSLVHLWNACLSAERMKAARDATALLLAALGQRREPPALETLGEESALLVVRLSALGLTEEAWDRVALAAPRAGVADAVPADWLAARVLASPSRAGRAFEAEVRFDGSGQRAVQALARLWHRDVDLLRAAAERGLPPRGLAEALAARDGDLVHPAQRLIHGALSRPAWDALAAALDGAAPDPAAWRPAPSDAEIDVLVWTDKPVYRPHDIVTVNVSVSRACHLTLIDVDRDGRAIVLFPNELEPDNLIAPAVTVRVPGRDAGYQLRFDQAGEEHVVAICQRAARRPLGIAYDYEKQRFAVLGDWRTFLATAREREAEIEAREGEEGRRRRRSRASSSAELPAIAADGPAVEGRAAITVAIEPEAAP